MRAACLAATGMFALFSYWQLNDLEQYGTRLWYGWLLAYGSTAALSLFSARRLLGPRVYWIASSVAALAAALRASQISWGAGILNNAQNPAGNEAGGLLVVALWLAFLGWRSGIAPAITGSESDRTMDPPAAL